MVTIVLAALLAITCTSHGMAQEPECICLEELEAARGLINPLVLRFVPDGSDRKFIAEQTGVVWVFMPDGVRLPRPFLNMTEIIRTGDRTADERGFLALAFHPQFTDNGKVYVYYSIGIDDEEFTRLSEVRLAEGEDNVVDPASARTLISITQPFGNHNGGELIFDTDGTLLIFTGDGGSGGDPFDNAQNKGTFLGKVLRIDVDSRTDNKEYGIPPDNPFLGDPQAIPELYALGFRNPWRAAMDPGDRTTGEGHGRIFVGDVGQNSYEEIDILEKGGNFAWAAREGPACYKQELCGNIGPEVLPIHYYDHRDSSKSITGGPVYRGCANPRFNGWYLFGDFVTGQLWRLLEGQGGVWSARELSLCWSCPTVEAEYLLSWGVDERGEVYLLGTDDPQIENPGGRVYRIVDPDSEEDPCPLNYS